MDNLTFQNEKSLPLKEYNISSSSDNSYSSERLYIPEIFWFAVKRDIYLPDTCLPEGEINIP